MGYREKGTALITKQNTVCGFLFLIFVTTVSLAEAK